MSQGLYPVSFSPYIRSDDCIILFDILQKWSISDIFDLQTLILVNHNRGFQATVVTYLPDYSRSLNSIMRFSLLLDLLFTLSATTATLDSWPSTDDSLFAASDSTFDSPALPANELASTSLFQDDSPSPFKTDLLPENPETDPPGLIPWDLNNDSSLGPLFENLSVDDSFQLADCSASSENGPLFSKSRTRRNDSPGICEPRADSTPPDGTEELLDLGRLQRELDVRLNPVDETKGTLNAEELNEFCSLFTVGVLPWGVCSSGNLADELLVAVDPITVNGGPQTLAYTLTHCTLGTSSHPKSLFLFLFHSLFFPFSFPLARNPFEISVKTYSFFRIRTTILFLRVLKKKKKALANFIFLFLSLLAPGAIATCPGRTLFCCKTYEGTDAQVCLPLYKFFKSPFPKSSL